MGSPASLLRVISFWASALSSGGHRSLGASERSFGCAAGIGRFAMNAAVTALTRCASCRASSLFSSILDGVSLSPGARSPSDLRVLLSLLATTEGIAAIQSRRGCGQCGYTAC